VPTAAVVAILILAALLVIALLRRPASEGAAGLIQQQLIELRARFDQLVAAQHEVPKALAQGSAEQARVLQDVRERLGQLGEVTRRLETMGETVSEVQQLLQVPRLRGTIGEVWLEELLRQILPGHYEMQHQFRSGERVDAVLRLGERLVPVDAKFPLEACQRMLATSGPEQERERRAFARSLKDRIDEIADKYIRPDEGTYEFALMYIPAESVYYEAVMGRSVDPDDGGGVLGHAMQRSVIPVSPHTFYAYLLVILHGLKGMRVEQRAREIQDQLGGLRQRFDAFWSAYQTVGTHLANAQKKFEDSARHAGRVRDRLEQIAGADPAPDRPALERGEDEVST